MSQEKKSILNKPLVINEDEIIATLNVFEPIAKRINDALECLKNSEEEGVDLVDLMTAYDFISFLIKQESVWCSIYRRALRSGAMHFHKDIAGKFESLADEDTPGIHPLFCKTNCSDKENRKTLIEQAIKSLFESLTDSIKTRKGAI